MASKQQDDMVAVVAVDGSGNYATIGAALAAAPRHSSNRHVIHVKKGVYKEMEPIVVDQDTWNPTLVGDGIDVTIISGARSNSDGYGTDKTGTVSVHGKGFICRDLTIENTAGAAKHQAVALLCSSDESVVYRCAIKGYQDTLYAYEYKQFYHECRIEGTVDFIFGNATVVFQNCTIVARLPLKGQQNTITAQKRGDAKETTGFSFQSCVVSADEELARAGWTVETYLGRPWRVCARVVFMECTMSSVVHPKGWLQWENNPVVDRLYYGEYKNDGPGAAVRGRVGWGGFHAIADASEAAKFTVQNFIQGDQWLPGTGVDYKPGLRFIHAWIHASPCYVRFSSYQPIK